VLPPLRTRADTDQVIASAPVHDTGRDLVAAVVEVLAEGRPDARARALRRVLHAMPAMRSLTLRAAPGGPLLASAVRSSPTLPGEGWALDVPVRRNGEWSVMLVATSSQPFTPEQARALRDVSNALSLVAVPALPPLDVAAQAVLDAEADLALVAAELGETVAESIVALRHTDPAKVREAATAALAEVRRIGRELRASALGDGLRAALAELRALGATVDAEDPALDGVAPAVAVLVERVAEAVCRQVDGTLRITASMDTSSVKLRVECADNAVDASELERWRRRAEALRGGLRQWPGGVELSLPAATGPEGRHDDRLDL
jgi:hypothetical protein